MNQIIFISNKTPKNYNFKQFKNHILKYKLILYFSIFIIFILIIFYIILKYNSYKNEKFSKALMNNFSITKLYSNFNNTISNNITDENISSNPFIIGIIEIKKIDIMYPILSNTTDELLKIAPCRFFRSYAK